MSGQIPAGDVRITANINSDLHLKLKIRAAEQRTTVGEIIEQWIEKDSGEMQQFMQTQVMLITPEIAAQFLAKNKLNRPLNLRRVGILVEAIKRGEWCLNGDAIRFNEHGDLIDGQHRLTAIVVSGLPIQTLVVYGLSSSAFKTIDTGSPRTAADLLSVAGEKHYSTLAAGARVCFTFEQCGNPYDTGKSNAPTHQQLMAWIDKNPSIRDVVHDVSLMRYVKLRIPPSAAVFCKFHFDKKDKTSSDAFFSSLESGIGLSDGSAVLALRNRLDFDSNSIATINTHYKCAIVFKAFKAFRFGHKVKMLRVRIDGDAPEKDLFSL